MIGALKVSEIDGNLSDNRKKHDCSARHDFFLKKIRYHICIQASYKFLSDSIEKKVQLGNNIDASPKLMLNLIS